MSLSPVSADELGEGDTAGLAAGAGVLSAGDADGCTVETGALSADDADGRAVEAGALFEDDADGRSVTTMGSLPEREIFDGLLFSFSIGAGEFVFFALPLEEADLEFCSLRVELQAVSANISRKQSSKHMILRMFYLLISKKYPPMLIGHYYVMGRRYHLFRQFKQHIITAS